MQRVRKVPLRKCVGCQNMFPKKELVRVVLTPESTIDIDPTGKRNGRGAYLCNNEECLRQARKRKSLERALKTSIAEDVYQQLEALLHASPTRDSGDGGQ